MLVEKFETKIHILGIDMSKPFDTVKRAKLMDILAGIVGQTECRMIRVLLANTTLRTRIKGHYGETFTTVGGIPQGDGLSPVLFIIYMENALRELREKVEDIKLRTNPDMNPIQKALDYMECCYADDTDFITTNEEIKEQVVDMLAPILQEHALILNVDKTERIALGEQIENHYARSRNSGQNYTMTKLSNTEYNNPTSLLTK
jgi:retron-type reverse transcriptase